jgi:TPR repeat protein
MIYEKGELVPRNRSKAVRWLKLAAEQGFQRAQTALDHISRPISDRPRS